MHEALQYISWAVGVLLNLLVVRAMLRGAYREYSLAFAYAVALLLVTVAEIAISNAPPHTQFTYYWTDEIILDVLVFALVIGFIDRAAGESQRRPIARHWLIIAAVVIFAASYIIHRGPNRNRHWTLVSRDLNLCAVILDLILWTLLLAARRPNRRLLLLSGGLGLQLTGAIMGETVRHKFHSNGGLYAGTLLEVITGFMMLYIWWHAFRRATSPSFAGRVASPPG